MKYVGSKMKAKKFGPSASTGGNKAQAAAEEAREALAATVLAHVPAENFDFKMKAVYLALMVRRVIEAQQDNSRVDDRWGLQFFPK